MILPLLVATAVAVSPLSPLPVPTPHFSPSMKTTAASPSAVQGLRFSLRMPDRPALDSFIAEQQDPASNLYRHWLTPEGFGERFGQSQVNYQRFVELFEESGMKVRTYHNRLYLEAVGTVSQVEKLVGVKFIDVAGEGQSFRSFRGTPRLPASFASLVQSVSGFDTRPRFHHLLYANGSGTGTMGPQDLRRFYDIESLHSQGYGGQLSTVVLVGELAVPSDSVDLADVQFFYSAVSDSPATPVVINLPQDQSGLSNEQYLNVELDMDMQLPTVAAPLMKTVTMVMAPQDNLILGAYSYINEYLPDTTAVSLSFSSCEPGLLQNGGLGDALSTSDSVAQGVSEGIAYFTGSGDTGAADCEADGLGAGSASVGFPADVPYMTTMGGLQFANPPDFDANDALTGYAEEAVWNEAGQAGGGGGVSTIFARPWYQQAPGTTTDGGRLVPDLALLATSTPGIAIVDQAPGLIDGDGDGTSDASPLGAGMLALVNDFIGGCRLGSPDPELYALGRWQYGDGGITVFHDTTIGNNSLYGVTGFSAGPGFDEATGLGSLDVAHLAAAWPGCPPLPAPGVDGGPRVDAGLVPYSDGGALPWIRGYGVDAGPRPAYSQCGVLSCDAGPTIGASCLSIPEGPSQCFEDCTLGGADTCSPGNFCYEVDAGDGVCAEGCTDNSGCVGSDAGPICVTCGNFCSEPGNDAGLDGAACATNADCPFGASCATPNYGFPDGFCAAGCPSACGCSPGTACNEIVSNEVTLSICAPTCSVSAGGPCRQGYTCYPQNSSDHGFCMPACTAQNQLCNAYAPAGSVCNPVGGGTCIPPGVTPPTLTSSSSGGSSNSVAASSSSGSTSSSGASTTVTSSTTATSSTAAAGATSSSGSSHPTSATSTSSGDSTHTTAVASSTGSTGTSSSAKSSGGCSCNSGGNPEGLLGLLLAGSFGVSRRRRSAPIFN